MQRAMPRRVKGWVALLQVLLLCLVFVAPVSAATPSTSADWIKILTTYRVVRGDALGNLNLEKPITRAEMITIMVRALGAEEEAAYFKGFGPFKDVQGHWAEGYINYAAARNLVKGDGNGYARPQEYITYAEALTLLVRLVEKEPTVGDWPVNIMLTASDLNILPTGVTIGTTSDQAVRGRIFESLAKAITTIETPKGTTYAQEYIDKTPPTLTVNNVTSPTPEAKIRLSGTTSSDVSSVTANGKRATVTGTNWSVDVDLSYGANSLAVVAEDMAGNQESTTVSVERRHPVAKVEITGPDRVPKGQTANYAVKAFDSNNKAVGVESLTAKIEGGIGSFNLQTGVFSAGSSPAKGKIVVSAGTVSASVNVEVMAGNPAASQLRIRPVNNGQSVSITKEMLVQVDVLDSAGTLLTDDYGRVVTLSAYGVSGLVVTPTKAETIAGVATFRIRSNNTGSVSLTATTSGLSAASTQASFGTGTRIQLSVDPSALMIGGAQATARVRATLVDESGQPVTNTSDSTIYVTLSQNGTDGQLTDGYLSILRGMSTSTFGGDDAFYAVGTTAGTARFTGTVTSSHNYTVDPTSLTVTVPQVGSNSTWDVIYPGTQLQPNSTPQIFYIRLVDGVTPIPGAFAFQLEVTTSNNEEKVNGIPNGVSIGLLNTGAVPVSDGIAEGASNDGYDIIARTVGGTAALTIAYNKVGQVNVKVIGMPGTSTAYGSDGSVGAASAGSVVQPRTFTFNFTTTPTAVKLTADSNALGTGKDAAAVSTAGGQSFKLKAYLTDGTNWIPGTTGSVTLEKVTGTSTVEPTVKTIPVVNGQAEFTVVSNGTPGMDVYKVTAKKSDGSSIATPSNDVYLEVQNQSPGSPTILAARGMSGVNPGAWYYVAPTDDSLELELASPATGGYGIVRVFQVNYNTPFYTSDPVELNGSTIRITIPKNVLPKGRLQYQVSLKNAVGETNPRVLTPDFITNAIVATNIVISSAKYDQVNGKLYIYGSGFGTHSGSNPDTIYPHMISITDASLAVSDPVNATVNLSGAPMISIASSVVTLDVSAMAPALANLSGSDVTLSALSGWYIRYNGDIAGADAGNPIGPMAKIDYVSYDRANHRLILNGAGFSTGSLNISKLKITNGTSTYPLTNASNSRLNDSSWSISLSSLSTAETALQGDATYTLTVDPGWFYDGTIQQTQVTGIAIYDRIAVSNVTYDAATQTLTINGTGFTDWTVVANKLQIVDLGQQPNDIRPIDGTFLTDSSTDTQLKIQLTTNPLTGTGKLSGSSLYVIGDAGWLVNTTATPNRTAAPIPLWTLRLPPQP